MPRRLFPLYLIGNWLATDWQLASDTQDTWFFGAGTLQRRTLSQPAATERYRINHYPAIRVSTDSILNPYPVDFCSF
jgi:hypothetical protein